MQCLLHRAARLCALVCAGALASCASIGPDYVRPSANVPEDWHPPAAAARQHDDSTLGSRASTRANPDPSWWRGFNDPELERLVERAVGGNLDLQQALLRIEQARLQQQMVRGAMLPSIAAGTSYDRSELGADDLIDGDSANERAAWQSLAKSLTPPLNFFQSGFDASWELDLFGGLRRAAEAAGARTQAAFEQRNDALVSLEAEVASTYIRLRGAQTMRRLTEQRTRLARRAMALMRSRQASGLASETEVQAIAARMNQSQAELPQYEQQITQAMNSLAILLGERPGALDAELSGAGAVPLVPPVVPIGLPSALVRRRPDVREAQARLHAATANIGVALAQLFPNISLTGAAGIYGFEGSYLTRWADHFFFLGPQISLPIFQGGTLSAQVKLTKVQQASAALHYRKVVLEALREVEDALAAYRTDQLTRNSLARTQASRQRTLELARDGYRNGLASLIDVLNAQQQVSQSQEQTTQMTLKVATDLVALYKALGGGWQNDPNKPNKPNKPDYPGICSRRES